MNPGSQPHPATQSLQNSVDVSPAAFRQHLLRIIEHDLADGARIKPADHDAWVSLFADFSDHLITGFPTSPHEHSWDVLEERVLLIDTALEAFLRLFAKAENLFDGHTERGLHTIVRLVGFCTLLDGYDESNTFESTSDTPKPGQLRDKTFAVIVKALSNIGDGLRKGEKGEKGPSWLALRDFLDYCLIVCNGGKRFPESFRSSLF